MRIHTSEPFREELTEHRQFIFEKRGDVDVKVRNGVTGKAHPPALRFLGCDLPGHVKFLSV